MSSIKRAFHRARNSIVSSTSLVCSKSLHSSASDPSSNGLAPLVADSKNGGLATPEVDHTNAEEKTAAQRQQEEAHVPPSHVLNRPSTENARRQLSFTEERVQRAEERRNQDEQDEKERKELRRRLHEEVCTPRQTERVYESNYSHQDPLRDNYGDLPLNMSQLEESTYPSSLSAHSTPVYEVHETSQLPNSDH